MRTQAEFLAFYSDVHEFQKIILKNVELGYICFEFIDGVKFSKAKIEGEEAINQIYEIVSKYRRYETDGFGYLYENNYENWSEFLRSEVEYSAEAIQDLEDYEDLKVRAMKAIDNLENVKVDKYLIHGDFGAHNFLNCNGKIMVIDPMPVVGDYLYDFYFAVFSDVGIFGNVDRELILSYFDANLDYKKNVMEVAFFIRLCRAWKYNKGEFEVYREWMKV